MDLTIAYSNTNTPIAILRPSLDALLIEVRGKTFEHTTEHERTPSGMIGRWRGPVFGCGDAADVTSDVIPMSADLPDTRVVLVGVNCTRLPHTSVFDT